MTGSNTRDGLDESDNSNPSNVDDVAASSAAASPVDAATSSGTIADPETTIAAATLESLTGGTDDTAAPVIYNKDGTIRKKPGRKPGQKTGMAGMFTSPEIPGTQPAPSPKVAKSPAERKAQQAASEELARAVLATTVGALKLAIGDEWDFQSPEEAQGMKAATAAYIEAKGDGKLTPEGMLLLVASAYALPRLAHENTRSKIGQFFDWVKSGLRAIFSR